MAAHRPGWWTRVRSALRTAAPCWPYYVLVSAVGLAHLVEVNLLDPTASALVHGWVGEPRIFATWEAPVYEALDAATDAGQLARASAYYLVGFVALLAATPSLVAFGGDRQRLKATLLTYPVVYLLALPGYLLLPQANPYVALELADPFSPLVAGLEGVYYLFTTPDNTFPSLHVAYTAALTVQLVRSSSPILGGAAAVHGMGLVVSVVYVRVHWLGDVLGGLAVAALAVWLVDRALDGRGRLAALVDRLDRLGRRGLRRAAGHVGRARSDEPK